MKKIGSYWVCSQTCERVKTDIDLFLDAWEELYGKTPETEINGYALDQKIEEIKLRKSF